MNRAQRMMQEHDLHQAMGMLRLALLQESPHPAISGIGNGKNMRRWLIEQALDATSKAMDIDDMEVRS